MTFDCTATLPGHEPAIGWIMDRFAREFAEWAARPMVGTPDSRERMLRSVLAVARSQGLPAVRAYLDADECIIVEMARPRGFG